MFGLNGTIAPHSHMIQCSIEDLDTRVAAFVHEDLLGLGTRFHFERHLHIPWSLA